MQVEKRKNIEELNLIDDFLFTESMLDSETAQHLAHLIIERATGMKADNMSIQTQKTLNGIDTDKHGIRMDVEIRVKEKSKKGREKETYFDIEPNNIETKSLPKRNRYYQALKDIKLLDTGIDYDKLPDVWTIWILPYDPFGKNRVIYSVKNIVEEFPEISYNDGIKKLYLYTDGKDGGSDALKALLKYLKDSTEENAADSELKILHENVNRLKHKKDIGVKYMQMWEILEHKKREWKIEGKLEGESIRSILIIKRNKTKGRSIAEIADISGDDESFIEDICNLSEKYPDKSEEELYEEYQKLVKERML